MKWDNNGVEKYGKTASEKKFRLRSISKDLAAKVEEK